MKKLSQRDRWFNHRKPRLLDLSLTPASASQNAGIPPNDVLMQGFGSDGTSLEKSCFPNRHFLQDFWMRQSNNHPVTRLVNGIVCYQKKHFQNIFHYGPDVSFGQPIICTDQSIEVCKRKTR